MRYFFAAGLAAALLAGTAAQAQQAAYSWTGMGANTRDDAKCSTYKMTIDVTVDGTSVKGQFQQQGRDLRTFTATLGAGGAFKTKATVGGGNSMDVKGIIADAASTITLDGYCKFGGKLTKK